MSEAIIDKVEFKERVRAWAEKLDSRVTSISVRPMTTKWASYSTIGRLTFSTSTLPTTGNYGRALCART
jgi:predicted metal-dependent hydrolase